LADRTAAHYDRQLHHPVVRPSVRPSVCNTVHNAQHSWLVYKAKSCTSVFLEVKFLFVRSDIQTLLL